jgi:hypothetical protein
MAGVTRNTCLNSQPVSRVANHSTLASTAHTIPASWPMPVPRSTKITAISAFIVSLQCCAVRIMAG